MHKEIEGVITEIYINGNKELFASCCCRELEFISDLVSSVEKMCTNVMHHDSAGEPSADIVFQFRRFVKENFKVQYSSVLSISKLCGFYYLQHEFSVDNQDVDGLFPELDGFGEGKAAK